MNPVINSTFQAGQPSGMVHRLIQSEQDWVQSDKGCLLKFRGYVTYCGTKFSGFTDPIRKFRNSPNQSEQEWVCYIFMVMLLIVGLKFRVLWIRSANSEIVQKPLLEQTNSDNTK
jgi:hypothetical protein